MSDNAKQRELPFPELKEDIRLATIERLWGDHPKVETAARMFAEENQRQAEQAAKGGEVAHDTPPHQRLGDEENRLGNSRTGAT